MICNAKPSSEFEDLVLAYQSLHFYFPSKTEQLFTAHTSFWIAIPLGDPIEALHAPTSSSKLMLQKPYVFASNFQSQPMYPCGNFRIFGIELSPAGLHSLLDGIPGEEIVNKIMNLDDFFPSSEVLQLQERIGEEKSFEKQIAIVEAFLRIYMRIEKRNLQVPMYVTQELMRHQGMISINSISNRLGASEQHVRRKFKEVAGVSPKFHGRIMRFNALLQGVSENQANWLTLVERFGYFDQSHLIKDFNTFTGKSPLFFDPNAYELNISQSRK